VTLLYRNIKTVASRQVLWWHTPQKGKFWRILFEKKGIFARNLRQLRPKKKKTDQEPKFQIQFFSSSNSCPDSKIQTRFQFDSYHLEPKLAIRVNRPVSKHLKVWFAHRFCRRASLFMVLRKRVDGALVLVHLLQWKSAKID
jgi:hypothetical protein